MHAARSTIFRAYREMQGMTIGFTAISLIGNQKDQSIDTGMVQS
jgi:hypothetical protein